MTNLELKAALKALEARVAALEARESVASVLARQAADYASFSSKEKAEPTVKNARALCPHCNAVPAYYFHVKNCQKKKNNNGDDGIRDPSGS